ncbi:hypothetical protein J1N35_040310 [Gossypium stocksii]|uniref:Uncharacterized protein n=1 Tax=Gossypium stocksii TaxID=47602 RepID=A0A9D3UDB0_9ROSI|nr:hypothetical protein J1N35_040310 [Gossypium stocksii]
MAAPRVRVSSSGHKKPRVEERSQSVKESSGGQALAVPALFCVPLIYTPSIILLLLAR